MERRTRHAAAVGLIASLLWAPGCSPGEGEGATRTVTLYIPGMGEKLNLL